MIPSDLSRNERVYLKSGMSTCAMSTCAIIQFAKEFFTKEKKVHEEALNIINEYLEDRYDINRRTL